MGVHHEPDSETASRHAFNSGGCGDCNQSASRNRCVPFDHLDGDQDLRNGNRAEVFRQKALT